MKVHELKTWPEPFQSIEDGRKTHEVRLDDRGFCVGDVLHLREYDPGVQRYTGREAFRVVSYLTRGPEFGVREESVVMSIGAVDHPDASGCTGMSARWCPIHGDCACPVDRFDSETCPLHAQYPVRPVADSHGADA